MLQYFLRAREIHKYKTTTTLSQTGNTCYLLYKNKYKHCTVVHQLYLSGKNIYLKTIAPSSMPINFKEIWQITFDQQQKCSPLFDKTVADSSITNVAEGFYLKRILQRIPLFPLGYLLKTKTVFLYSLKNLMNDTFEQSTPFLKVNFFLSGATF